ncbi:MAG: hypothetical protein WA484_01175 [Solirubrobacteraceae bacterium]
MDFARLSSIWTLSALAVALAVATALAGCSSSSRELRTPGQSAGFVTEVASGEPYGDWHLASHASPQAAQAWAARARIGDLGRRLRGEEASWMCEMGQKLVTLGTVGAVTSFDSNDIEIVTKQGLQAGAKPNNISAMMHDASTIPFRDMTLATVAVCGPPVK